MYPFYSTTVSVFLHMLGYCMSQLCDLILSEETEKRPYNLVARTDRSNWGADLCGSLQLIRPILIVRRSTVKTIRLARTQDDLSLASTTHITHLFGFCFLLCFRIKDWKVIARGLGRYNLYPNVYVRNTTLSLLFVVKLMSSKRIHNLCRWVVGACGCGSTKTQSKLCWSLDNEGGWCCLKTSCFEKKRP